MVGCAHVSQLVLSDTTIFGAMAGVEPSILPLLKLKPRVGLLSPIELQSPLPNDYGPENFRQHDKYARHPTEAPELDRFVDGRRDTNSFQRLLSLEYRLKILLKVFCCELYEIFVVLLSIALLTSLIGQVQRLTSLFAQRQPLLFG